MEDLTEDELRAPVKPGYCACGCGSLTKIARQTNTAMGWKAGVPRRFLRGHHCGPGVKSPAWKGGRKIHRGYVFLLVNSLREEDQVLARTLTNNLYVREHRLVMARHLGRSLHRDETVHHISGDKEDNRLENLELLPRDAHAGKHAEIYAEVKRLRAENEELRGRLGL